MGEKKTQLNPTPTTEQESERTVCIVDIHTETASQHIPTALKKKRIVHLHCGNTVQRTVNVSDSVLKIGSPFYFSWVTFF